jgi:hypothetical protein
LAIEPVGADSVFTGAGHARNAFNVLSATLCVAIGGGAGTLSEIALALKAACRCGAGAAGASEALGSARSGLPRRSRIVTRCSEALETALAGNGAARGHTR